MTRTDDMITRYGEAVKRVQAARMLNCSAGKVSAMLKDGRLREACQGTRVDVRSIAEYIEAPKQIDFETRARKKYPNMRFYV